MKTLKYFVFSLFLLIALLVGLTWRTDLPAEAVWERYQTAHSDSLIFEGQTIHYTDRGRGPALLLIHGTSSSLHTWSGWASELEGQFRMVALDLPGFGLSGPSPDKDYSKERYTALFEALRVHLTIAQWTVVGNSFGGHLASLYAYAHPSQVQGLVLINSSGWPSADKGFSIFDLAKGPLGPIIAHCTPRFLIGRTLRNVYANQDLVSEKLIDRHYELLLYPGNRKALRDRLKEDYGTWNKQSAEEIMVPTLLLWGTEDPWFPEKNGQEWAAALNQAEYVAVENAGHVPMEEAPMESSRRFLDWYKKNRIERAED